MNDFSNVEILEVDNKKGSKKTFLLLLVLILIILFGIGLFFFLRYAKNNSVTIKLENKVVEFGDQLDKNSKHYINNKKCKLDFSNVDINKIGKYKYYAKCGKKKYTATIEVKDTTPPNVILKTVNITPKKNISINDFIVSVSDLSEVSVDFENEINRTYENGLYLIPIVASDKYDNKTTTKGILLISSALSDKFLVASKEEKTNYDASLKVMDKIGINNANYYNNSYRVYEYTFNNIDEYNKALKEYEEKKTIENITGNIIEDNKNLTIQVLKVLTRDELNSINGYFPYTYDDINKLYTLLKYKITVENQ